MPSQSRASAAKTRRKPKTPLVVNHTPVIDGAADKRSGRPLPLSDTRISVRIAGGLAVVATERVFKNAEEQSIEATMTFPVPVQAVLTALEARIDGRVVVAKAQRRKQARATYEAAIDDGKTAVLHEEVLRGIHVVSVGHVPPGKEVSVTSTFAVPLTRATMDGKTAALRIPTTIGDIFGRSPLSDADDLVSETGVTHGASLTVSCTCGAARLADGRPLNGETRLSLDAPIDIVVEGFVSSPLEGVAADGRRVVLTVSPAPQGEVAIFAEVLADRSGSMDDPADGSNRWEGGRGITKHAAMRAGLRATAATLRPGDKVRLWQFDNAAELVRAPNGSFAAAVDALSEPRGGTEIGGALTTATKGAESTDVVLITDGKSHALDVQTLARTGKRFTVVLVGEDSLEANVGHLAALSGGEVFFATADTAEAVGAALASLRTPHVVAKPLESLPARLDALLGGMTVTAEWGGDAISDADPTVGALAAALALPRLPEEAATALAEAHGIVCHLTSLVLVDEAGEAQEGIPGQRKVPLMAPRTAMLGARSRGISRGLVPTGAMLSCSGSSGPQKNLFRNEVVRAQAFYANPSASMGSASLGSVSYGLDQVDSLMSFDSSFDEDLTGDVDGGFTASLDVSTEYGGVAAVSLAALRGSIDWATAPEALRRGDLTGLSASIVAAVGIAALLAEVVALAALLGVAAEAVVIALLARAQPDDRSAARLARAVLGKADDATVAVAATACGL